MTTGGFDYETARIQRIFTIGSQRGTVREIAKRYNVHPSYVSMARRVVSVWGDADKNEIKTLSLGRLYGGALLAQKIGRKRAYELMFEKDSETLRALARGDFFSRKKLPNVDDGIYAQVMEQYDRFDKAFQSLNPDQNLSFDRFLETVIGIVGEIDDGLLVGVMRDMWGDAYG